MHSLVTKLARYVKSRPLFSGSFLILCCIIVATQYQYWFGLYSSSNLKDLKEEIQLIEFETDLIQKTNEELIREKRKLNSGQEALEGVARLELGMIKPGEQFYVFKEKVQEDSKEEN